MNFNIKLETRAVQTESKAFLGSQYPRCFPFVKWAGGKGQLIPRLPKFVPQRFERYFEPFLGGGAMFFYLVSKENRKFKAILSDTNQELIIAFKIVKESVEELIKILRLYEKQYYKSRQEYYYKLRKYRPVTELERAARFITLNKTCYNGLYRVNKKGEFNVPMGRYKNPLICDVSNLRNISTILRNLDASLYVSDYVDMTDDATGGDFIYFDPPYNPVSETANFTGYTNAGFSSKDQEQLSMVFKKLDKRGCKILLSNSDTPMIRKLYENFSITEIRANRAINSAASKRTGHTELLIYN